MSISDKFNKLSDKIGDPPGPTTPDRAKDATPDKASPDKASPDKARGRTAPGHIEASPDKASLNEAPGRTAPGDIGKGARTVKEAQDPR